MQKEQIKDPEYRKIKHSEHIDVCGCRRFIVFPFYTLFTERATERKEKNIYSIFKTLLKLTAMIQFINFVCIV